MLFKLLRPLTIVAAVVALTTRLYSIWQFYTQLLNTNNYSTLRIVGINVQFLTMLTLPVISILIVVRSKNSDTLYLALALALFSCVTQIPYSRDLPIYALATVLAIITGVLFICSMQYFPVRISNQKIESAIRWRWLKWYAKTFLDAKKLWIWMPLILLAFAVFEYFNPRTGTPSDLLILITGFLYLYINFKTTTGINHAKILWLFWGLAMYILANLVYYSLYLYGGTPEEIVRITIAIIMLLILFFSFVMSLFFADTFNTGVFVRRSMVNGLLFLLIVFIYNTLEHYVLHWVSHKLHVSDAVIASMLSGLLVLFISPLHHRLTHYLNKRLKGPDEKKVTSY